MRISSFRLLSHSLANKFNAICYCFHLDSLERAAACECERIRRRVRKRERGQSTITVLVLLAGFCFSVVCRCLWLLFVVSYLISRITELVKITLEHVTARHAQAHTHTCSSEATAPRTHTLTHTRWQQKQSVPLGRSPVRCTLVQLLLLVLLLLLLDASPSSPSPASFSCSGAMSKTQKSAHDSLREIANMRTHKHTHAHIYTNILRSNVSYNSRICWLQFVASLLLLSSIRATKKLRRSWNAK